MEDDPRLAAYRDLMRRRPDWFATAGDDGIGLVTDPDGIEAAKATLAEQYPSYGADATALGVLFDSPYYTVVRDAVRRPDGSLGGYVRVFNAPHRPEGVVILPVTHAREVVLTREFRHPVRGWRWQVPRGFCDEGETGEQAAARELEEELGTRPLSLTWLGEVEPDSGALGARPRFYLARIERFEASGLGDEAIAEARAYPPDALAALIREGGLLDGPTLSALSLWRALEA